MNNEVNCERQLELEVNAKRAAYSALLDISMDAKLEDGTPVLSLAFEDDPFIRERMEKVFLGQHYEIHSTAARNID